MEKYDVIVLGGGPGGYVAAIRAAKRGKRIVLIQQDNVDEPCLT